MSHEDNDIIFRQVGRSGTLDLIHRLERVRLALREDRWMQGAEVITDAIAEISRLRSAHASAVTNKVCPLCPGFSDPCGNSNCPRA